MLESFCRQMRQEPESTLTSRILADWLEEQGDPRAALLRVIAENPQNLIAVLLELSELSDAEQLRQSVDRLTTQNVDDMLAVLDDAWKVPGNPRVAVEALKLASRLLFRLPNRWRSRFLDLSNDPEPMVARQAAAVAWQMLPEELFYTHRWSVIFRYLEWLLEDARELPADFLPLFSQWARLPEEQQFFSWSLERAALWTNFCSRHPDLLQPPADASFPTASTSLSFWSGYFASLDRLAQAGKPLNLSLWENTLRGKQSELALQLQNSLCEQLEQYRYPLGDQIYYADTRHKTRVIGAILVPLWRVMGRLPAGKPRKKLEQLSDFLIRIAARYALRAELSESGLVASVVRRLTQHWTDPTQELLWSIGRFVEYPDS